MIEPREQPAGDAAERRASRADPRSRAGPLVRGLGAVAAATAAEEPAELPVGEERQQDHDRRPRQGFTGLGMSSPWACGFRMSAARAGDSVSAFSAEITVEAAMVSANCL